MGPAPTGCALLEQKFRSLGHRVPDARQFIAGRLRVSTGAADGRCEFVAKGYHLLHAEQVGARHVRKHFVRLADGVLPGLRVNPVGNNAGERINHRCNLRRAEACSGLVAHPPVPEDQIQHTPEDEDCAPGHEYEGPA